MMLALRSKSWLKSSLSLGLMALALSSCGSDSAGTQANNSAPQTPSGTPPAQPQPQLVYADNWIGFTIRSWPVNVAKFSDTAHFVVDRNACGRGADGAIAMETWNKLATLINQATAAPMGEKENCIDPGRNISLDGKIELVRAENVTVQLFEARGYEHCTKIADADLAKNLLLAFDDILNTAYKEDCRDGWGN